MVEIVRAKNAGYCYGVERALRMAEESLVNFQKPLYSLGPLIHNPQVVEELEKKGIKAVNSLDDISCGTVIIRSHGVEPQVLGEAKKKGLNLIDATCPFVRKAQLMASRLKREGYKVVIVGERTHPEVRGILSYAGNDALVIESSREINRKKFDGLSKVGVVVQTTQSLDKLRKVVARLLTFTLELKVWNTICNATRKRQQSARKLALNSDLVIVIGGKNSANTTRLFQICQKINPLTYHIESADEIKKSWFKGVKKVGLTAGASTPNYLVTEVEKKIRSYFSSQENG